MNIRELRWKLTEPEQFEALYAIERLIMFFGVLRDGFIRCGDVVRNIPSGEKWIVAFADYQRNDLSWCGWPEGVTRLSECSLDKRATDEQHADMVDAWLTKKPRSDNHDGQSMRVLAIRRLHRQEARS